MKKLIAICAALLALTLLAGCSDRGTTYWDLIIPGRLEKLEQAEETEVPAAVEDYLDTSAAGIIQREMQKSIAEGEDLDAGSVLSNAIIEATHVSILEDTGDSCTLRITYPDVASALIEEAENLPSDADHKRLDKVLLDVAKKVQKGKITTLEGTYQLPIVTNESGVAYIQWTLEAKSAMSGGIAQYLAGGIGNE